MFAVIRFNGSARVGDGLPGAPPTGVTCTRGTIGRQDSIPATARMLLRRSQDGVEEQEEDDDEGDGQVGPNTVSV